jgi:hypothetical protein
MAQALYRASWGSPDNSLAAQGLLANGITARRRI